MLFPRIRQRTVKSRKDGRDTVEGCRKIIAELQRKERAANARIYELEEMLQEAQMNEIKLRLKMITGELD